MSQTTHQCNRFNSLDVYCITVWGNTCTSYIEPLERIVKRAVRLISGSNRLAHTAPLFQNLNILPVTKLLVHSIQLFMYKYYHKLLPRMFVPYFVNNFDVHGYHTRQSGSLHVSYNKSISIRYTGVNVWNYFSKRIEPNMPYHLYTKYLKRHVLINEVAHLVK